jgi:hypothetical protein
MDVLNETEVAVALGVSIRTLARWRVSGDGPPTVKVANRVGYPREELIKWLAEGVELGGRDPRQKAGTNQQREQMAA